MLQGGFFPNPMREATGRMPSAHAWGSKRQNYNLAPRLSSARPDFPSRGKMRHDDSAAAGPLHPRIDEGGRRCSKRLHECLIKRLSTAHLTQQVVEVSAMSAIEQGCCDRGTDSIGLFWR